MQDKAPDPPVVSGGNLDQVHLVIGKGLQPEDFRSDAVKNHVQEKAGKGDPDEG